MKTIAVLGCFDTKDQELRYVKAEIERRGLNCRTIDVSTSAGFRSSADHTTADVSRAVGVEWVDVEGGNQHELLALMAKGARALVGNLYKGGEIHGLFSCGGLQNTTIAAEAAQELPIGVPKLILSTVASGQRSFDSIVGAKDIVTMPSISDFAGLNAVNRTVIDNAVAAIVGMVLHAGREIPKTTGHLIGTTLMGATNDGVVRAIDLVRQRGFDVVSFHSTGAGGRCLEDLIGSGVVTAAMDLTLHEIVYEYFGHGFGYGAPNRLMAAIDHRIPLVVCPAGIDFICQWRNELFDDIENRKIHWHNQNLAHVKLNAREITDISRIVIERLNTAHPSQPIKVVLPTKGFRNYAGPGERLHAPDLDKLIVDLFRNELRADIPQRVVDAGFMDPAFAAAVADDMTHLMERRDHD